MAAHGSSVTRRALLRRRTGAAGPVMVGVPARVVAQSPERNVAVLDCALSFEYLQAAFYTESERSKALKGARWRPRRRSARSSTVAFGTSARSATLTDWLAGGFAGIHGTDRPDLPPGRVPRGCARMCNAGIVRLVRLLPVATPVTIR